MIIEYQVGQIPARPLAVLVKDDRDNPVNLASYSQYEVELLGSNNEKVDLAGVELQTTGARTGRFAVVWPKGRTVFNKRGDYLLRIVLRDSIGSRDYTTPLTIRVREFGRYN